MSIKITLQSKSNNNFNNYTILVEIPRGTHRTLALLIDDRYYGNPHDPELSGLKETFKDI